YRHACPAPARRAAHRALRLRSPTLDDAEAIFAHYATDPQVTRFVVWGPHADTGVTRSFLSEALAARERGERWPWVVERRADGRLLGMIEVRLHGATADFGYVLERPSWGQGYATEAARALAEWAHGERGVSRLTAVCDMRNPASARVLEKAGLRCEGVRRRALTHGGTDVLVDVLSYAWVRPTPAPGEPQLLELDHVQLAMPRGGEERARAFWRDLLGLREVPRPAEMAGRPGLWFERGAVRIHVGVEEDFRPALKAHPALRVSGYDALLARLAVAGHASKPAETLGAARRAHVPDPFGNRVELIDANG
ncbi:MAG TPA: GNAT family N-acetyltransferase, partial [Planctomycetota bacterium]|nr:GNAT family N-acetyltransferase [Planctomycetota bacterium]